MAAPLEKACRVVFRGGILGNLGNLRGGESSIFTMAMDGKVSDDKMCCSSFREDLLREPMVFFQAPALTRPFRF